MSIHGTFYKNAAWQYLLQVVKYLLPLLTLPYLTRVLAPEGYAICAYVASFMTFVQVFVDFGFNLSGTKRIVSMSSPEAASRAVGAITQARLALCAIAGLIVFFISCFVPILHDNLVYSMLAYAAVCGRALVPDFVFQGKEKMGPITVRYFLSKGLSTVLTFVFVHSLSDILWVPVLDIVASVVALSWSFAASKRLFGIGVRRASVRESIEELKTSALYCISNVSSAVLTGFTTILIGIVVQDVTQISFWSLAMSAVSAVQSLYAPIVNSLYPHMVVSKDFRFAKRMSALAFPFVLIGTVAFAFASKFIMLVLGGADYVSGSYILVWISPMLFFSFYSMLLGWPVLGAAGHVVDITKTTICSAAFSMIALLAFALFDQATILIICVIRCVSEALLCCLRLVACLRLMRSAALRNTE